jgi:hypothetical protein
MTVTRQQITATIGRYLDRYPADRAELDPLLAAVDDDRADLSSRATLPGHVTCGAAGDRRSRPGADDPPQGLGQVAASRRPSRPR